MKSKTRAKAISQIISAVLQHDSLKNISNVLAAIGRGFENLVNFFVLDQLASVGLFSKKMPGGGSKDMVSLVLITINFYTALKNGSAVFHILKHSHCEANGFGRLETKVSQLD